MEPYYVLKLLPPLGHSRKLKFDNLNELLFTLSNLYERLVIDFLPISESETYSWKKNKFDHFCECIVITRINPALNPKHENHFINSPPGKTIPIESLIYNEPQPKPITDYKKLVYAG